MKKSYFFDFPVEWDQPPADTASVKDGLSERRPVHRPWDSKTKTPTSTYIEPHGSNKGKQND
jgi:hypothetical protein